MLIKDYIRKNKIIFNESYQRRFKNSVCWAGYKEYKGQLILSNKVQLFAFKNIYEFFINSYLYKKTQFNDIQLEYTNIKNFSYVIDTRVREYYPPNRYFLIKIGDKITTEDLDGIKCRINWLWSTILWNENEKNFENIKYLEDRIFYRGFIIYIK